MVLKLVKSDCHKKKTSRSNMQHKFQRNLNNAQPLIAWNVESTLQFSHVCPVFRRCIGVSLENSRHLHSEKWPTPLSLKKALYLHRRRPQKRTGKKSNARFQMLKKMALSRREEKRKDKRSAREKRQEARVAVVAPAGPAEEHGWPVWRRNRC